MMLKRLNHLVIGGAAVTALALGGSAIAGAATGSSGSPSTTAILQESSGEGRIPAFTSPNAPGTAVHANAEKTVTLTDHEQYVKHHQRLASLA
jgi:hypothetical protein